MKTFAKRTPVPAFASEPALLIRIEAVVSVAMGSCVLMIGLATGQWWTHVMESLPLWLLAFTPRHAWTRAMMAMAAFAWIFMMVAMTPEFRNAVHSWNPARVQSWLAPVMVMLCLGSMFLNLSLLRGKTLSFGAFGSFGLLLVLCCYLINFWFMDELLAPLEQVVAGRYQWTFAIAGPSFVSMAAGMGGVRRWSANADLRFIWKTAVWLALFWTLFVGSMIVSQLPGIKNY